MALGTLPLALLTIIRAPSWSGTGAGGCVGADMATDTALVSGSCIPAFPGAPSGPQGMEPEPSFHHLREDGAPKQERRGVCRVGHAKIQQQGPLRGAGLALLYSANVSCLGQIPDLSLKHFIAFVVVNASRMHRIWLLFILGLWHPYWCCFYFPFVFSLSNSAPTATTTSTVTAVHPHLPLPCFYEWFCPVCIPEKGIWLCVFRA